jgi:hypothetical protein
LEADRLSVGQVWNKAAGRFEIAISSHTRRSES